MKALVIAAPRCASIEDVPYPNPKAGEVTIKVHQVGICGTDFHIFEGEFISPYPIIPGHEFSGEIFEVGEGVTQFTPGDRVSADPSLFCGECEYCLTHRGNQCSNWNGLGNTVNGSMAEYVAVPARNVVKIRDSMSFAEAAFIEPVACVVHGINRLNMKLGDRVLLFGAGAMGQMLIQSIVKSGASELVVVDVSTDKLHMALENGATMGVLNHDVNRVLRTGRYERGFDVVVDVTGIPAVIETALDFIGPTGKYLQFGVAPTNAKVNVNPFKIYNRDWTILGSMAINYTFLPALEWIQAQRVDVLPLVSKTISLEEVPQLLSRPKDPSLFKVQIKLT